MASKCFPFSLLVLSLLCSTTSLQAATTRFLSFRLDSMNSLAQIDCPPLAPDGIDGKKLPIVRPSQCWPLGDTPKLTHSDILGRDNARISSLSQRSLPLPVGAISAAPSPSPLPSPGVTIPDHTGTALGTLEFVVVVGYGTPSKPFSVAFDTGSDLSWIQCKPCSGRCYPQHDPLFDPTQSSSYAPVPCGSSQCSLVGGRCSGSNCIYSVRYGDGSFTLGNFSRETLTLTSSRALANFEFGCGESNFGSFRGFAGLLGLGRGQVSLPSQTASVYGGVFSYCLPSFNNQAGFLNIGPQPAPSNAQFTPMIQKSEYPSFYFVELVGINVGGTNLSIPPTEVGTIIDSGTILTYLPAPGYVAVRERFKLAMTQYTPAPPFVVLDTCYNFTGQSVIAIPAVSLLFSNGAVFDLDFNGILYFPEYPARGCLAFAAAPTGAPLSIIGNIQQRSAEVIYDVAAEKIGFVPFRC